MVTKDRKEKGSRAEREAKKYLEYIGYVVTKSGGSLGAWDLIGFPTAAVRETILWEGEDGMPSVVCSEKPICIQVKSETTPSKKEIDGYADAAELINGEASCAIWLRKDGAGRRPAIWYELAFPNTSGGIKSYAFENFPYAPRTSGRYD